MEVSGTTREEKARDIREPEKRMLCEKATMRASHSLRRHSPTRVTRRKLCFLNSDGDDGSFVAAQIVNLTNSFTRSLVCSSGSSLCSLCYRSIQS